MKPPTQVDTGKKLFCQKTHITWYTGLLKNKLPHQRKADNQKFNTT